ncbi:MAG: hypothetical protein RL095_2456 [Verrucomicrobiota bacterium]|jgi:8-oxo-dGTP diphosphatase
MQPVVAALLHRRRRILLARRAPGEKHAGAWEFPGGKVEPGESSEEALRREIREELELELGELREVLRHELPQHGIVLIFLLAACPHGEPRLSVHDRCDWLPPEELDLPGLLPGDRPAVAWLQRNLAALGDGVAGKPGSAGSLNL